MNASGISVVIPSALRKAPDGEAWLTKALRSVCAQTLRPDEVIIGVDPGERGNVPPVMDGSPIVIAEGNAPGHQAATNAAAGIAGGLVLAFLEDDDEWVPEHLATLVAACRRYGADFVSCSALEVTTEGKELGPFDFPFPSTWFMTRLAWVRAGGFDTRFRIHHDNEFLARLNRDAVPRVHLVEEGADIDRVSHVNGGRWLQTLSRFTPVVRYPGMTRLTVRRTVHAGSVLGQCRTDPERARRSQMETDTLVVLTGGVPW